MDRSNEWNKFTSLVSRLTKFEYNERKMPMTANCHILKFPSIRNFQREIDKMWCEIYIMLVSKKVDLTACRHAVNPRAWER